MSREVRMVPKDYEHPKREDGNYIALFGWNYEENLADWDNERLEWDAGNYPSYADEESKKMSYSEWAGEQPNKNDYMPAFPEGTATHCMMYETTSEGTPISPAFSTPEELAKWLFDNEASSFGSQTGTYEGWLRVAKGGFAPSAVLSSKNGLQSGVDAFNKH